MTEEIIINCAFYKDGVCASPINKTCEYCKNIDVSKCYHKQLKRLEQENKALKDNNNHLQVIIDDGRAENKRFREENKELKKEVKLYDCISKWAKKNVIVLADVWAMSSAKTQTKKLIHIALHWKK